MEEIIYSKENKNKILEDLKNRNKNKNDKELKIVKEILEDIRTKGDKALKEYTEKFDSINLESFLVSKKETEEAFKLVGKKFIENIEEAKENILEYHNLQKKDGYKLKKSLGVYMGRRVIPLEKVGLYVPGGTASYPSSVLMNAIPALVAGVNEIIMITPPNKEGKINPYVLVAAKICGIKKIYKIGGAQGIGALAYGTETVEKVDKIVGPGNIFVALAKKEVFGEVDIDMIAGPSEILIIADDKSNPKFIAADLMSQAEHDRLASSILITTSKKLGDIVLEEIEVQIEKLDRKEIIKASLNSFGKIIVCESIDECFELSNIIAPEHLEILLEDPFKYLEKVKNAGSVFLGEYSTEPIGDYFGGTNHVLPTCGTAKFSSPLSVDSFLKTSSYLYYSKEAILRDGEKIIDIAEKEGLDAHANSVKVRLSNEGI